MSVREPLKFRKAALAGVVALALTGTGAAIAWSASDPTASPPSSSLPGKSDKAPGHNKQDQPGKQNKPDRQNKPDKAQRPQHLHSESVVKKADGTFETELTQHGTVEAASETSVTVKSEDGYTQTYVINADTKVKPSLAEVAAGDAVRISGVKNGDQATAERIVEGAGAGPGLGRGHGKGPK